jgi:excisionase family DNA binding protein
MNTEEQILTLQETAKLLKVSQATLRRWIKSGQIPAFRVGRAFRVRLADIEKKFKKQTTP